MLCNDALTTAMVLVGHVSKMACCLLQEGVVDRSGGRDPHLLLHCVDLDRHRLRADGPHGAQTCFECPQFEIHINRVLTDHGKACFGPVSIAEDLADSLTGAAMLPCFR